MIKSKLTITAFAFATIVAFINILINVIEEDVDGIDILAVSGCAAALVMCIK